MVSPGTIDMATYAKEKEKEILMLVQPMNMKNGEEATRICEELMNRGWMDEDWRLPDHRPDNQQHRAEYIVVMGLDAAFARGFTAAEQALYALMDKGEVEMRVKEALGGGTNLVLPGGSA